MTHFKLDPKKYEGHTESPLYDHNYRNLGAIKDAPNLRLLKDAPDILAHALKLEAEKAELIDALSEVKLAIINDLRISDPLANNTIKRINQALHKAKGGE